MAFSKTKGTEPVRYAVRKALDQEYRKETARKQTESLGSYTHQKKTAGKPADQKKHDEAAKQAAGVAKRDFFGRAIREPTPPASDAANDPESQRIRDEASKAGRRVWVTFHDGFSNAVRKPISMGELLAGL